MISPHTPLGTRLVVVWADPMPQAISCIAPWFRRLAYAAWLVGELAEHKFKIGEHYVLQSIEENKWAASGFAARVHGVDGAWALECFDLAALPDCLVRLQETQPLRVPESATC